ncbi:MAG: hypothetical protein ACP5TE_14300, partial [Verrucomicrobiia bacterium]
NSVDYLTSYITKRRRGYLHSLAAALHIPFFTKRPFVSLDYLDSGDANQKLKTIKIIRWQNPCRKEN